MSVFDRFKQVYKANHPKDAETAVRDIFQARTGDQVELYLTTYDVAGIITHHDRNGVSIFLKSGNEKKLLYLEKKSDLLVAFMDEKEGHLERGDQVPEFLTVDEVEFYLSDPFGGSVNVQGSTPFKNGFELYIWNFKSDGRGFFQVNWQDDKFEFYMGDEIPLGSVRFIPNG